MKGITNFILFLIIFSSLVYAADPYYVINSPTNNTAFDYSWAILNFTVYDLDLNTMIVNVYGSNTSNPLSPANHTLLFTRKEVVNGTELIYNWTAPVVNLSSNITILMHFNNISGLDNESNVFGERSLMNGTKKGPGEPAWNYSGKFGAALQFDGVNDYVKLPNNSLINIQEATIETWIYPYDSTSGTIFSAKENEADTQDMFLFYLYGGRLVAGLKKGNAYTWLGTGDTTILNNTWTHVAITVNSTGNSLYVNGKRQAVTYTTGTSINPEFIETLPPPPSTAIQTYYIGKVRYSSADQQLYKGLIDEFAFYNRSLSLNEIQNDYRLKNNTYFWRIVLSDPTSTNTSIRQFTIGADWFVTPLDFGPIAINVTTNGTLGNITINNSGHRTLNITFNISNGSFITYFDKDFYINLSRDNANSNATVIGINVTAPDTSGIYDIVFTIYANLTETWNEAIPYMRNVTARIIATAGEPALSTIIDEYPNSILVGETANFSATVKNVGSGIATDVYLWYELPAGWTNISGNLNQSLGNLSVGSANQSNITVSISSSASSGLQNVIANSSGYNETNYTVGLTIIIGDSVLVDIIPPISAPSGGGEATASAIGGGGGGKTTVKTVQQFDVLRGGYQDVPIEIKNIYTNSILQNVKIKIEGFLPQYLNISPETLDDIPYNTNKTFYLNVFVPTYFEKESFDLKLIITGDIIGINQKKDGTYERKPLLEQKIIKLLIREVSPEKAQISLDKIKEYINELQNANIPYSKLTLLDQNAQFALDSLDFEKVKLLGEEAKAIRDNAFASKEILEKIQKDIKNAESKWLKVSETKRSLELALKAYEREDFVTALQRSKDTQLLFILETKGKVNILWLLKYYWWALIIGSIVCLTVAFLVYKKLAVFIINQRIININKEEEAISELLKEAQKNYLIKKSVSESEYNKLNSQYNSRLNKIRNIRLKLRNKRIGIKKLEQSLDNTKKEKGDLIENIKKSQTDYLQKGKISRGDFFRQEEQNQQRLAEIEEEESVIKQRLEKQKLSSIGKIMNKIENLLIRGKFKKEKGKYYGKWIILKIRELEKEIKGDKKPKSKNKKGEVRRLSIQELKEWYPGAFK
ncbi:MAG: NEW3 domain-containing protein [Candidatus Nanoarchaeia archaeon]|nr:NEW3 domain-containing protein [Candidatus Nanoarchaeia archaeon]MDD5588101.1 NEW3 domain-containing protein [Candidatus Nanoarchaeia archaeon]